MSDLLDKCLAVPGKTFGDGYGFALAYLDDHLTPAWLRDGALDVASRCLRDGSPLPRRDSDVVRFLDAYLKGPIGPEHWMVEAAQLLLQAGLQGDTEAGRVLALCGHPGYPLIQKHQERD